MTLLVYGGGKAVLMDHSTDSVDVVSMPSGGQTFEGELRVPADATGVVVFAHGSGSSRRSPRNKWVADRLRQEGLATLLMDLLTATEEAEEKYTRHHRFDIGMLSERLIDATRFVGAHDATRGLPIGYFGASTGAAAALVAATGAEETVGAIVSRGGRPDLAGAALPRVRAPTLLIVGGADQQVIGLNEVAIERMTRAQTRLVIVPGATHLFPEPGALERVGELASEWFGIHLGGSPQSP